MEGRTMKVYLMCHNTYSPIKEKETENLQTLINECNTKIIGKIGFTIFEKKIIDNENRNVYENILYTQRGTADNKK
jgi:hypothetical protein